MQSKVRYSKILSILLVSAGFTVLGIPGKELCADSVKINKTGTVYQNVKTTTENGIVTVDFEDGSQKRFRAKDVTVTPGEVVWLETRTEEPSFLERVFGKKEESKTPTPTSEETSPAEEAPVPYMAEGIFGGVALLFFLLP